MPKNLVLSVPHSVHSADFLSVVVVCMEVSGDCGDGLVLWLDLVASRFIFVTSG